MHELRPALLHEIDFIDFDNFINQFKDAAETCKAGTTPKTASEFIYQRLSDNVKAEIDEKDRDTPVPQGLRANLIEDLNRILENEEIDLTNMKGSQRRRSQPVHHNPWKLRLLQKSSGMSITSIETGVRWS